MLNQNKKIMKGKYKLKKDIKKILITLLFLILDILLCRFITFNWSYTDKTSLGNIFILVGCIWLLAGQFMWLYCVWE